MTYYVDPVAAILASGPNPGMATDALWTAANDSEIEAACYWPDRGLCAAESVLENLGVPETQDGTYRPDPNPEDSDDGSYCGLWN